jgi:hypothetical protein
MRAERERHAAKAGGPAGKVCGGSNGPPCSTGLETVARSGTRAARWVANEVSLAERMSVGRTWQNPGQDHGGPDPGEGAGYLALRLAAAAALAALASAALTPAASLAAAQVSGVMGVPAARMAAAISRR